MSIHAHTVPRSQFLRPSNLTLSEFLPMMAYPPIRVFTRGAYARTLEALLGGVLYLLHFRAFPIARDGAEWASVTLELHHRDV